MKRKRQAGQAFILVLIILAIGALVVVPTLRLTTTVLRSSQTITQRNKGLYACEAAQQKIMWMLLYDIDRLVSENLADDGDSISFTVDVCGTTVYAGITMRAVPGEGGTALATDHRIKPTKTVSPATAAWEPTPFTYIINLEHISSNTSQGLDAVYDFPPGDFGASAYDEEYGSWLSLDEGDSWLRIPDPDWDHAKGYLKWPADYDPDTTDGAFSSDPGDTEHYFHGIRNFDVRQVKEIKFRMTGRLGNNETHCNWVVLKPWNTLSGPQAPITVGSGPGECVGDDVLGVTKASDPEVILPGVPTDIKYTISITNLYTQTRHIQEITDFLPPGFEYLYLDPIDPGDITTEEPWVTTETINGVVRKQVQWTTTEFPNDNAVSIAGEETLTLTFWAHATQDVSGSYYNEVLAILAETGLPPGFGGIGLETADYASNYSWLAGAVMVPAYDSTTGAEGENITANMALDPDSVRIISWHPQ